MSGTTLPRVHTGQHGTSFVECIAFINWVLEDSRLEALLWERLDVLVAAATALDDSERATAILHPQKATMVADQAWQQVVREHGGRQAAGPMLMEVEPSHSPSIGWMCDGEEMTYVASRQLSRFLNRTKLWRHNTTCSWNMAKPTAPQSRIQQSRRNRAEFLKQHRGRLTHSPSLLTQDAARPSTCVCGLLQRSSSSRRCRAGSV